jgi:hypothetical protein
MIGRTKRAYRSSIIQKLLNIMRLFCVRIVLKLQNLIQRAMSYLATCFKLGLYYFDSVLILIRYSSFIFHNGCISNTNLQLSSTSFSTLKLRIFYAKQGIGYSFYFIHRFYSTSTYSSVKNLYRVTWDITCLQQIFYCVPEIDTTVFFYILKIKKKKLARIKWLLQIAHKKNWPLQIEEQQQDNVHTPPFSL